MNERPMAGMVENGSNSESEDHGAKRGTIMLAQER